MSFLPVVVTNSELIGERTMQLWGRRDGITPIINHRADIQSSVPKRMVRMQTTITHTHTDANTHIHTHVPL